MAKNINGICLRSLVNVESVLAAAASCKNNKSHTNKLFLFSFLYISFYFCMPGVLKAKNE